MKVTDSKVTPQEDNYTTATTCDENKVAERIQQIPLCELHPFSNHPFRIADDEKMQETIDSIAKNGVLVPAIARLRPEGGYELISGHRRKHGCEALGMETMPVIVRDLTDDQAILMMVDSNIQRESLLPSERAFAYKMRLDALKRSFGRQSLKNVSQEGSQRRSDKVMAEQTGESRNQIQRYIRLTHLIPPLLEMVDAKKIAIVPAVELSFLTEKEQHNLLDAIESEQTTPTLVQAQRLKQFSHAKRLSVDVMRAILGEAKGAEKNVGIIELAPFREIFPKGYSDTDIKKTLLQLAKRYVKTISQEQTH